MRRFATLLLVFTLGATGCQGVNELAWGHFGRDFWQRPDDVVAALEIRPGERVADIGSGEGYFLPRLASAVGPDGRVYAVEVEAELAQELESKFAESDRNVAVVLGRTDDPLLPDGGIDLVLLLNTFHHIEDRPAYFARLRGDLSPRGRVAVIEPDAELGGLLSVFVKAGHASSAAGIEADMRAAGYRAVAHHAFLPVQVFEVFEPAADVD
jgi:ubiquinone/menaquinone biosynthesis C-methylase UbiE